MTIPALILGSILGTSWTVFVWCFARYTGRPAKPMNVQPSPSVKVKHQTRIEFSDQAARLRKLFEERN